MTTMKTKLTAATGVLGAIFLLAAGCGGGGGGGSIVHVLDSNDPIDVPAGTCAAVTGATIPAGASTTYSIADDNDDNMDIAVIDDAANDCSPVTSDTAYTTGSGPGRGQGRIPVTGTYILAINCLNLVETCIPTVDSWTWSD